MTALPNDSKAPDQRPFVIFNNIVTPYTSRLYNLLAERLPLAIVSAAGNEANRNWGQLGAARFSHQVLPGLRIQLGPWRYAYLNTRIFRTLSALRPRLLLINGFYPSMVFAALWALVTRTPMGLTIDGWAETMPSSPYHRLVRPLMLRACRVIVTPGTKGTAYFASQGIEPHRIVTVPLVPAWDGPADIPSYSARTTDLLWCAHLNEDSKNVRFLVDLCRALQPKRPNLTLRIVGDGPARESTLNALRELGIAFTHDAAKPWHEMAAIFADARLLVLPSLWEAWGLVCNEAMQCGTPTLVSPHVGASDDLVRTGETGAVLPLDANLWADTANALLNDPAKWQVLSDGGRREMQRRSLAASADALGAAMESAVR